MCLLLLLLLFAVVPLFETLDDLRKAPTTIDHALPVMLCVPAAAVVMLLLLLLFAVVPLFETLDDLRNASATMDTLLGSEWYRNHIQTHHGGVQEVMIGE